MFRIHFKIEFGNGDAFTDVLCEYYSSSRRLRMRRSRGKTKTRSRNNPMKSVVYKKKGMLALNGVTADFHMANKTILNGSCSENQVVQKWK